jgi:hypothetical protein
MFVPPSFHIIAQTFRFFIARSLRPLHPLTYEGSSQLPNLA